MTLFDTHVHFDDFNESGTLTEVLQRAQKNGVKQMLAIGGTPSANRLTLQLAERYPAMLHAAVGMDREMMNQSFDMKVLMDEAGESCVKAIGECGLDYYYHPNDRALQKILFEKMIELALHVKKPLIVHSRDADDDTADMLAHYASESELSNGCGVLHCFTGDQSFARTILDLNMFISFSGIVTFKNADALRSIVQYVPMERMLIETDSPYLAPVPMRGKKNEPAFVKHVAEIIGTLKGLVPEDVASLTTDNAKQLFDVPQDCTDLDGPDESPDSV